MVELFQESLNTNGNCSNWKEFYRLENLSKVTMKECPWTYQDKNNLLVIPAAWCLHGMVRDGWGFEDIWYYEMMEK
jgi:hypothetical protein